MNILYGVMLVWVPEALLNVIFFLVVHYGFEKMKSYFKLKVMLRTLLFVVLILFLNVLIRSLIPVFSISGILATIAHILCYRLIYGANLRKSTAITVISMFVIMNMEVITMSLYHSTGDLLPYDPIILTMPTRLIQVLLIVGAVKVSKLGVFKVGLIVQDWHDLNKHQKINVTSMIALIFTSLFVNANVIDIYFQAYNRGEDIGVFSNNILSIFLSTIVFTVMVLFVASRMNMFQHFHTIARTVKDSPLVLFENLIIRADEDERNRYAEIVLNALKRTNQKELCDFCDEYKKRISRFNCSVDEGLIKGTHELGIQMKFFNYILECLSEKDVTYEVYVNLIYEAEKAKCELHLSDLKLGDIKDIKRVTSGVRFNEFSVLLESQGYSVFKAIKSDLVAISIE